MQVIKKQINRLRAFAAAKPKLALPVFAATGLIILLLVSFIVAQVIKDEQSEITSSAANVAQIQITKNGFVPASIVVDKGTKIIWTNEDEATHQLQANPHPTGESLPELKSEILNNQQTYEYTANSPGTYGYHDHVNPTTNGTIEVRE